MGQGNCTRTPGQTASTSQNEFAQRGAGDSTESSPDGDFVCIPVVKSPVATSDNRYLVPPSSLPSFFDMLPLNIDGGSKFKKDEWNQHFHARRLRCFTWCLSSAKQKLSIEDEARREVDNITADEDKVLEVIIKAKEAVRALYDSELAEAQIPLSNLSEEVDEDFTKDNKNEFNTWCRYRENLGLSTDKSFFKEYYLKWKQAYAECYLAEEQRAFDARLDSLAKRGLLVQQSQRNGEALGTNPNSNSDLSNLTLEEILKIHLIKIRSRNRN